MNIAYVTDAIYPYNKGGKEKRLYELSMQLVKMGHDVHIYSMKWWNGPEMERIEHGVHLHAISKLYPMYHNDRRSIHEGVMFGFACFRMFRVAFDTVDVDHMPFFPLFSMWFVCKVKRKHFYATWHEALKRSEWTNYMGLLGNFAAIMERISAFLPRTITASSSHTEELIKKELKRSKRLHTVSPGVDIDAIQNCPISDIECDVLYVGRLVKDKHVATLIKSIHLLSNNRPDIKCVILGSGIEESNIRRSIKKHHLEKNVEIIHSLPHALDVYGLMKAASVFVLPSVREGFGIVVLEALACGTPVVTVNSLANASKELVEDGVSGSIVDLNSKAIADAIQKWFEKIPDRANIAKYISKYDWSNLASRQVEVYKY
jgi:glycosyltransferase involved in cell wall biosynthesis